MNPDLRGGARRVGFQPTIRARGSVGWNPTLDKLRQGWSDLWAGTHPRLADAVDVERTMTHPTQSDGVRQWWGGTHTALAVNNSGGVELGLVDWHPPYVFSALRIISSISHVISAECT